MTHKRALTIGMVVKSKSGFTWYQPFTHEPVGLYTVSGRKDEEEEEEEAIIAYLSFSCGFLFLRSYQALSSVVGWLLFSSGGSFVQQEEEFKHTRWKQLFDLWHSNWIFRTNLFLAKNFFCGTGSFFIPFVTRGFNNWLLSFPLGSVTACYSGIGLNLLSHHQTNSKLVFLSLLFITDIWHIITW